VWSILFGNHQRSCISAAVIKGKKEKRKKKETTQDYDINIIAG